MIRVIFAFSIALTLWVPDPLISGNDVKLEMEKNEKNTLNGIKPQGNGNSSFTS